MCLILTPMHRISIKESFKNLNISTKLETIIVAQKRGCRRTSGSLFSYNHGFTPVSARWATPGRRIYTDLCKTHRSKNYAMDRLKSARQRMLSNSFLSPRLSSTIISPCVQQKRGRPFGTASFESCVIWFRKNIWYPGFHQSQTRLLQVFWEWECFQ